MIKYRGSVGIRKAIINHNGSRPNRFFTVSNNAPSIAVNIIVFNVRLSVVAYKNTSSDQYAFPGNGGPQNVADTLGISLAKKGAFFDRPHGQLAVAVYESLGPEYTRHLGRIKNMVDPGGLINPGHPIKL